MDVINIPKSGKNNVAQVLKNNPIMLMELSSPIVYNTEVSERKSGQIPNKKMVGNSNKTTIVNPNKEGTIFVKRSGSHNSISSMTHILGEILRSRSEKSITDSV